MAEGSLVYQPLTPDGSLVISNVNFPLGRAVDPVAGSRNRWGDRFLDVHASRRPNAASEGRCNCRTPSSPTRLRRCRCRRSTMREGPGLTVSFERFRGKTRECGLARYLFVIIKLNIRAAPNRARLRRRSDVHTRCRATAEDYNITSVNHRLLYGTRDGQ